MTSEAPWERVGLPPRIFLYTIDQVSDILGVPLPTLKRNYMYFQGRTTGPYRSHLLRARSINLPENQRKEWRIAENELIRWMKLKGFTFRPDGTLRG